MKQITINTLVLLFGTVVPVASGLAQQVSQFSFALSGETLQPSNRVVEVHSNEYWFETSAVKLNQGVALKNSVASPLVLVSLKQAANTATKLDVQQMSLHGDGDKPVVVRKVSADALQQVGPFSASVALMSKAEQASDLVLKSTQQFADATRLIVTVKEKNSPYQLRLSSEAQSLDSTALELGSVDFLFDNSVQLPRELRETHSASAVLTAPDGARMDIQMVRGNEGFTLLMPQDMDVVPASQGLYEVAVNTDTSLQGKRVQRTAKMALAISRRTATLSQVTLTEGRFPAANVALDIAQPGRFEVRLVLYGRGQDGNQVAMMESHAAMDSNAGLVSIPVSFPANLLVKSAAQPPYSIGHVRVYDQKQLTLLEEHVKPEVQLVAMPQVPAERGELH